ncbi:hypothetical protein BGZ73_006517 [Actinomortierella ambigua]|nr:hypothetical protein BGZ73_006517 [Actinomortierella ambigua]
MATVLCLAANSKRIYAVIADDKAPFGQTQRLFLARSQLQPSSIETNFQIITTKDYTYLGTDYSVDTKVSCAVAEELPSTQQDSIPSMAIMMARTAKRYTYRAYWGTMYTATNTTANNSTNTAPQSMAWKEIKSSMECPMDGDCDHQILAVPTTPAGFVHVTYRSSGNSVSASISAIKDWGFEDYSTIFRSPSKALGGSYLFGYSKDQLIVFQQAVHGQNDTITYSSFKIDSKSGLPSSKTPNTSEHIRTEV